MTAGAFSVYILRCGDDSLYTGIAADVERRVDEHRHSPRGAKYLKGRAPLDLVYSAVMGDRSRASKAEYRIKQLSRREKEALIAGAVRLEDLLPDQGEAGGCE